eukprot:m.187000 g.187000  ORF g.187000 m.187000 type:complete len:247 (+) comp39357_c1_seq47:100-840(+)
MAFQVQGFRIFRALLVILVLLLCVSLCDGSTITTMMPSGFQKRKAGDLVSVTCTFPTSSGNLRFEYNGVDSPILDAKKGRETVVIATAKSSTLTVKAVGFGLNAAKTGIAVQLDFNLTADHNGSTLRCKFDSTASADDSSESEYLRLTVLYCVSENPKLFALYGATTTGILLWFLLAAVPLLRCLSATAPLIRFWFSVAVRLSVAMETHHSAFNGMFLLQIRSVYWISARQLQCILQHQSNWQRMQ